MRPTDRTSSGDSKGDPAPIVLPVFYNATKEVLKQARKQYPIVLESPTKSQAFLDTIDDAIALKPHSVTAVVKTTG